MNPSTSLTLLLPARDPIIRVARAAAALANHAALAHAIDSAQLAGIEQVSVVEASPSAPEPPLKTKKK